MDTHQRSHMIFCCDAQCAHGERALERFSEDHIHFITAHFTEMCLKTLVLHLNRISQNGPGPKNASQVCSNAYKNMHYVDRRINRCIYFCIRYFGTNISLISNFLNHWNSRYLETDAKDVFVYFHMMNITFTTWKQSFYLHFYKCSQKLQFPFESLVSGSQLVDQLPKTGHQSFTGPIMLLS